MIEALTNCDELEIFNSPVIMDFIEYKWEAYARSAYFKGFLMHSGYVLSFIVYLWMVILKADHTIPMPERVYPDYDKEILTFNGFFLLYHVYVEFGQLIKRKFYYFNETMNIMDLAFIILGYMNINSQLRGNKLEFSNQLIMIACLIFSLMKMFFFLRLFNTLTYIVNMIFRVVKDLKVFIVFYMSFIFIGSLAFNLVGISENVKYKEVGPIVGTFLITLQLTVGNFEFDILTSKEHPEVWKHYLFWFIWYCYVIFGLVIILNFIIAEVGNSYGVIKENIDSYVQRERASMITEIEEVMSMKEKINSRDKFPTYIVSREMEM